jgi:phosphohistidine phosphatase
MTDVPEHFFRQAAAVPYRVRKGRVSILLVTAGGGRRWIVPKGVIDPGLTPTEAAALEAYEEAGVRGEVTLPGLGRYAYEKWGGTCTVLVFPLLVGEELAAWPESRQRERRWFDAEEAARTVRPAEVGEMIIAMAARVTSAAR